MRDNYWQNRLAPKTGGFTLVELLATLALLGFIITALYSFYLGGLKGWNRSIDQMEYQQSARIALERIISELLYASDFNLHDSAGEGRYREIRFRVENDHRVRRFRLAPGGDLVLDNHPTGPMHNKIALGIRELYFTESQNSIITVTISAGHTASGITLSASVRPRNYNPESGGEQQH